MVVSTFVEASVPNAPGPHLGVTAINQNSVRISFLDNSDNETGFKIFGNDINVSIASNDETAHSYAYATIENLTCDKLYTIQTLAYNNDGNSTASDSRKFNIHTTFGTECDDTGIPNAPGPYLGVTVTSQNSVRVSFLDNSDNELGFRILGDGIDVLIAENNETVKPYVYKTITGLSCNKVYRIEAVSFNANGTSLSSNSRAFNIHTTFGIGCNPNSTPIANAGIDKTVVEGVTVQLDGSSSSDVDMDALTYAWSFLSKPMGSTATLTDSTIVNPTFDTDINGTYVLQLIVNDGQVDSVADTVTITVINSAVTPQNPVAVAGDDISIMEGALVPLNATQSYDPDGTIVSYDWSIYGVSFANTAEALFSAFMSGTYELLLTVTDDDGLTDTDTIIITVLPVGS